MANLPITAQWHPGIYQLETDDPVEGGPEGIDNRQPKELGDNVLFLKAQMDAAVGGDIAGQNGFSIKMLDSKADQIDGVGRNLLTVFNVSTIQQAMAEIRRRCNNNGEIDNSGIPDFSGIMIGDYIDGIDLSAIPAENGGEAGQVWSDTYKNNRIVVAGLNSYKGSGDYEVAHNHIVFAFRNIPICYRMNPANDNTGGYPASDMRAFLDGTNGDGTGDKAGVTTAAFLNALKGQIGDYVLPIRKLLSNKVDWAWVTCSLWLPTEDEVFGASSWGEAEYGDGIKVHLPVYQKSSVYRVKKYNGWRHWWWEGSPASGSAAWFCGVGSYGGTDYGIASAVGGCAPAFCVA